MGTDSVLVLRPTYSNIKFLLGPNLPNTDFSGHFQRLAFSISSLVAQSAKNLPAVQETWVSSLGQEDPLEKEMATPSSILAWKISWTERPLVACSPWGRKELGMTE